MQGVKITGIIEKGKQLGAEVEGNGGIDIEIRHIE